MPETKPQKYNLRALDRALRAYAESWWFRALFFKFIIFLVGVLATLFAFISEGSPFLIATITLIAEFCIWRYSGARDNYETLHRELDTRDSFGWHISRPWLSDLLTQIPEKLKNKISEQIPEEEYFASNQQFGPKRAVENIQQSAWWSKHLARRAGDIYTIVVVVLIVGSFAVLVLSVQTIRNFDVLSNIGRVVTATIMLIFSLDLLRICLAYYKFSREAADVEARAQQLLDGQTVEMIDAIKLLRDYHLSRAESPLIPQWLWNLMQKRLNEIWESNRRR